ncbi:hypothetical protein ABW19_dt0209117 [Dactylella cylindrospora]|nr:hypothetical protein ABW19_dt0209117 [Dactylella cylindrospora]
MDLNVGMLHGGNSQRAYTGPPISIEEKLFSTRLAVTAKQLGFGAAVQSIGNMDSGDMDCSCSCSSNGVACPLEPLNFDQETMLQYTDLVYRNFSRHDGEFTNLIFDLQKFTGGSETLARLEPVFRRFPDLMGESLRVAQAECEPADLKALQE